VRAACAHLADTVLPLAAYPAAAAHSLQEFSHYLVLLVQQLERTGATRAAQVATAIQRLRQVLEEGATETTRIRQVRGQALVGGTWGAGLGGRGRHAKQAGVAVTGLRRTDVRALERGWHWRALRAIDSGCWLLSASIRLRPTVPRPHQALGALRGALTRAAGARSGDHGASGSQEAGPEAGARQVWCLEPLRRCFKYLDATQGGTAPQHLLASGSLGVPLLVARAVGELWECVEFDAAPIVVVDERGVTIQTAEVKSSLAGG
jgi:hypothetical protein